jgi:hypothetical protein
MGQELGSLDMSKAKATKGITGPTPETIDGGSWGWRLEGMSSMSTPTRRVNVRRAFVDFDVTFRRPVLKINCELMRLYFHNPGHTDKERVSLEIRIGSF